MKIILVNYRYYRSGGPEAYLFNVKELLERAGHKVIPFSVKSSRNVQSDYSGYFAHGKGEDGEASFANVTKSPKNIMKLLSGAFFNKESYCNLRRLINDENPDVVYVLQQVNALSPSVFKACKDENVRVIHRISDFNMICPRFDFLRDSNVCMECLNEGPKRSLNYNCCHNSRITTSVRVASMLHHKRKKYFEMVDAFVCPTEFTKNVLVKSGIDESKLFVVPTFAPPPRSNVKHGNNLLFVGRLSEEKGLDSLLDAMDAIDTVKLTIVGDCDSDYARSLQARVSSTSSLSKRVEFLGFLTGDEKEKVYSESFCLVCPSICVENMPNTVLEAYSHELPVVAYDVGCMNEIVQDGVTGFVVPLKDSSRLAEKIYELYNDETMVHLMGERGRKLYERVYSPEDHLNALVRIFTCK